MAAWQKPGMSDEWWTPRYVFDALGCTFDLDAAAPPAPTHVPARGFLTNDSLQNEWRGLVWMNAPFGGRNGLVPWLRKFVEHGNGIALVPDRTSAPWFQDFAQQGQAFLFLAKKIKFERPDGTLGKQPGDGTVLVAMGEVGRAALRRAEKDLGILMVRA